MANKVPEFKTIQDYCTKLKEQYSTRNSDNDDYSAEYFMDDFEDQPTGTDIKVTKSPDAHNSVEGVVNIMSASVPEFSIPIDKTKNEKAEATDKMEKFANALWYMVGRVRGVPLEEEILHSAVLYGEFACGIYSTKDLVEYAKGGSEAAEMEAEELSDQLPVTIEPYLINTCYPEYSSRGMSRFYRQTKVKSGDILDAWGDDAIRVGLKEEDRFEDIEYCDYWDRSIHAAWIDGKNDPLFNDKHNLPCIPIVCITTKGSMLYDKPEKQRHPFLYSYVKSKFGRNQSLGYTTIYSNIAKHGLNPQMVANVADKEEEIKIDKNLSGLIVLGLNEKIGPLQQQIIDPSVIEGVELAERKGEESMIYKQALGGNVASNAAYSTVALLNQSGRIPLAPIQKRVEWGIGKIMEIAFKLIQDGKAGKKVESEDGPLEIDKKDIPKNILFKVKLDVDLPMDDRQNAMVAKQLTDGEAPLVSYRWVRENILKVGQSSEMDKEIGAEKVSRAIIAASTQVEMQKILQKAQPQQPQQLQTGQQPQQPQQPQGQSAQSGLPMTAPMDLEQVQGGSETPPEMTL